MSGRIKLYTKADWDRSAVTKPSAKWGIEKYRDQARRDYSRLIHSPSFRRLQGKTQLFPAHESDFFRNRLTHSLEVAQIAKSIAIRINSTESFFKASPINLDLVEFAGLAHDLGHPPFGHNGEATLDRLMLRFGGFEGNAQTLRLLCRIEKKVTTEFPTTSRIPRAVEPKDKADLRLGLNLTYRTLASILKYDRPIPATKSARAGSEKKPVKGYYSVEQPLVDQIKAHVAPGFGEPFKTVECSVMDVADDIAYSTYDIEDAFKANFLSPLTMISKDDAFKERIASKVRENLQTKVPGASSDDLKFTISDVNTILGEIFLPLLEWDDATEEKIGNEDATQADASFILSGRTAAGSQALADKGYLRTSFTSDLVGRFIRGVKVIPNSDHPAMSVVHLDVQTFKFVETLKHFTFEALITSPMLKIAEKRGDQIITRLFECFTEDPSLMPVDWRDLYNAIDDEAWQARVVCDYISGMTDRYCVEMYARLNSENPITIWKPH